MLAHKKVTGLYYIKTAISEEQCSEIFQKLDLIKWSAVDPKDETKVPEKDRKRLVQQYGYYFDYATYTVINKAPDMPDFIKKLKDRLTRICKELRLIDDTYEFNQCIVNNYFQGEGISPHTDALQFGDVIGCFSIGCDSVMLFKHDNNSECVPVECGSLYIMSSDARYTWTHEMEHRVDDIVNNIKVPRERRISITFRHVKKLAS